jgi:ubiquinone/menaquinone biosynthesis C-methylase UbiE
MDDYSMQALLKVIVFALLLPAANTGHAEVLVPANNHYSYAKASRGGTGKYYLGREIAQFMDHRGAGWLERKSRIDEEHPDLAVQAMQLPADAVVADIGAGSGYFTFRIAALVPAGRVYAVDIQPEMLDIIRTRMQRNSVKNIFPVEGKADDPMLPEGAVDAVLLVDAYHEFDHPYEMMRGIVRSLRPGGRVFLIEYRGEDLLLPISPLHKMTRQQATREMQAVGLDRVETRQFLPTQHYMVFEKPALASPK